MEKYGHNQPSFQMFWLRICGRVGVCWSGEGLHDYCVHTFDIILLLGPGLTSPPPTPTTTTFGQV